ncbi:Glutamate receptor [Quillaja saponaria]|uniref:Glutamate receptor n=1 Tax=Quillaja saponaria TaxID=32244 RepID=A0AAD7LHD1_QUISA|nr:Glutamate receptor [Quillaja saponaria]
MDLAHSNQVQVIIGRMTLQEVALLQEIDKYRKNVPILSLTSPAISSTLIPIQFPYSYFLQIADDVTFHIQSMAAIVGHFRWRKVTAISEQRSSFSSNSDIVTLLSHSLRLVNAEVDHHLVFPSLSSLSEPKARIEKEFKRLKNKSNRVFLIVQSSLESAILLFEKAKQMGLMEKHSVWIVTDEVASLLVSVDPSVNFNMQGVIGFKTHFADNSKTFRQFKYKFQRKYGSKYPEEENSKPSVFALRAYDATWAIAQLVKNAQGKFILQEGLSQKILSSNFEGLSGKISFNNGKLLEFPTFNIINVIGNSYKELAFWSSTFGFSQNLVKHEVMETIFNNGSIGDLAPVYWPGGLQTVPRGWTYSNEEKPLRILVPARGVFNQFVNVSYDSSRNETHVTGFSITVFRAALKRLPYQLPHEFVPFYGSYD